MLQTANTNCPELGEFPHHSKSRIRMVKYYTYVLLFGSGLKAMLDPTAVRLTYTPRTSQCCVEPEHKSRQN